jgi:hypothetical protein
MVLVRSRWFLLHGCIDVCVCVCVCFDSDAGPWDGGYMEWWSYDHHFMARPRCIEHYFSEFKTNELYVPSSDNSDGYRRKTFKFPYSINSKNTVDAYTLEKVFWSD